MRFILDEEITNCGSKEWQVDLTNFELVMINDTTTIANGTCVLKNTVKSPWKMHLYGEMYDRGAWWKRFERKFDDFCKNILRPGEIWYPAFNDHLKGKGCPYEKGQEFPANEEQIYFDISFMPPTFQGRWRFTMDGLLGCYRVHLDFVDD